MPRLAEVQESFARAGCFVIRRFTPARDGALAFSRSVVRLRLGLAFGRQLIVLCRRNAKSFAGGPHVRAIAVTPVAFEKLVENFAGTKTRFVQFAVRAHVFLK